MKWQPIKNVLNFQIGLYDKMYAFHGQDFQNNHK